MHNILIVDDDEIILEALRHILRKQKQWNLYTFTDAEVALEMANMENMSVVISDYRMPYMDGVEFLVKVKELNPKALRLILSGDTDMQGMQNAINQAEIYRFVHKPVDPPEFISIIQQAVDFYDLAEENRRLTAKVKQQEDEIARRESAIKEFSDKHPAITKVDFDPDGSIILDLNSDV